MNLLRRIRQALWGTTTNVLRAAAPADAKPAPTDALQTLPHPHLFNESSWDRQRGNTDITVLSSAARTASGWSADLINYNARGIQIVNRITAVSGSFAAGEGIKFRLHTKEPVGGTTAYAIADFTPVLATVGWRFLVCYPGITNVQGIWSGYISLNDFPLTRVWRLYYHISGTNPSFTFYSAGMLTL